MHESHAVMHVECPKVKALHVTAPLNSSGANSAWPWPSKGQDKAGECEKETDCNTKAQQEIH